MSKIIDFPNRPSTIKQIERDDGQSPEEALTSILHALQTGETTAHQMVVAWSEECDGHLHLYFKIAGSDSLTSAVGLLEITKATLLE